MVPTDMEKAEVLSSVFFPDMPPVEIEDQRAIDVLWRMHHPPRAMDEFGVYPLEVISASINREWELRPVGMGFPLRRSENV